MFFSPVRLFDIDWCSPETTKWLYICRYRTGRVKLSGCKSWYVCIIDMHADVGEHDAKDETDYRNIKFVNLFEEGLGIDKGVTKGRRYTWEWLTRCTLFLVNLFQLIYLLHEFDIQRTVSRDEHGDSKRWTQLNSKRRLDTRQTVGCGIPSSLLALRVDLRGLRSKLTWIRLTFSSDTRKHSCAA